MQRSKVRFNSAENRVRFRFVMRLAEVLSTILMIAIMFLTADLKDDLKHKILSITLSFTVLIIITAEVMCEASKQADREANPFYKAVLASLTPAKKLVIGAVLLWPIASLADLPNKGDQRLLVTKIILAASIALLLAAAAAAIICAVKRSKNRRNEPARNQIKANEKKNTNKTIRSSAQPRLEVSIPEKSDAAEEDEYFRKYPYKSDHGNIPTGGRILTAAESDALKKDIIKKLFAIFAPLEKNREKTKVRLETIQTVLLVHSNPVSFERSVAISRTNGTPLVIEKSGSDRSLYALCLSYPEYHSLLKDLKQLFEQENTCYAVSMTLYHNRSVQDLLRIDEGTWQGCILHAIESCDPPAVKKDDTLYDTTVGDLYSKQTLKAVYRGKVYQVSGRNSQYGIVDYVVSLSDESGNDFMVDLRKLSDIYEKVYYIEKRGDLFKVEGIRSGSLIVEFKQDKDYREYGFIFHHPREMACWEVDVSLIDSVKLQKVSVYAAVLKRLMKPKNPIVYAMVEKALEKKELKAFLLGYGEYNLTSLQGKFTGRGMALNWGVYDYCRLAPQNDLPEQFEQAISEMACGTLFELLSAFNYCWDHLYHESKGMAPFTLEPVCIAKVKAGFEANAERLKSYKEFYDFGRDLPNGAYEWMRHMNECLKRDTGRSILG